ncbi:MAG: HAD family hydrolase [Mycobacteriales bacterium]
MAPLAGLLVDYGGVLTSSLDSTIASWCAADGIDPDDFARVMREWLGGGGAGLPNNPVHALETGRLSVAAFEEELARRLPTTTGGTPTAAGLLERMLGGFIREPTMVDLVRRARVKGIKTGLVSNSWGMNYPREGWGDLFDTVVISGEVGLRKPEPEIYRLAAERLALSPEECVFVDDLAPNVRGAAAVGMVAVHHRDAATTRTELETLFGVPLA